MLTIDIIFGFTIGTKLGRKISDTWKNPDSGTKTKIESVIQNLETYLQVQEFLDSFESEYIR